MQKNASFDKGVGRLRDIFLIVAAFAVLYLGLAFMRPLASPDEGRYAEIPREMAASGDWITPRLNGMAYFYKPPMFYWMQAASIKAFGINRISVRLPNTGMAIFGIVTTYLAARALYGRRAGQCSAAVLGTSALYFALGEIVTLDMTVAVFIAMSLFCFIVALKRSGAWRAALILLFFAFAACAVLTKGLIGVLIPAAVICLFALVRGLRGFFGSLKKSDAIWIILGIVLFLSIAVPWHALCAMANPPYESAEGIFSKNWEGQGFFWYYIIHEHFLRYIDADTSMREQPWWFFFVFAPVGLIPWLAFLPRAIADQFRDGWKNLREKNPEMIFFAIWVCFVVLFFSVSKSKLVPYIIPIYPALAVMVGAFLAKIWENPSDFKIVGEKRAMVALGFIGAIAPIPIFFIQLHKGKLVDIHYAATICAMLSGFMLTASLVVLKIMRRGGTRQFLTACFLTIFGLLMFFNPLALILQRPSSDEIAARIIAERKAGDAVIVAYGYSSFQDLPVLLDELVYLLGSPPEEQKFGYMREREKNAGRFFETPEELSAFLAKLDGAAFFAVENSELKKFLALDLGAAEVCRNGKLHLYKLDKKTDKKPTPTSAPKTSKK